MEESEEPYRNGMRERSVSKTLKISESKDARYFGTQDLNRKKNMFPTAMQSFLIP